MKNRNWKMFSMDIETRPRKSYHHASECKEMLGWGSSSRSSSREWVNKAVTHRDGSFWVSSSDLTTGKARWLFAWKWAMQWNPLGVVKTSRGTQMRVLRVWHISLFLFLSWHLGLPFVRELAGRARASESDQDQIPALSQINTMILTFLFST